MRRTCGLLTMVVVLLVGHTTLSDAQSDRKTAEVMKNSFRARGQTTLDRLEQDETQAACSQTVREGELPKRVTEHVERSSLATVRYPSNGKLMGDWRQAFHACSTMPRFGAKGILTETQITHLVGLLLDPASPVNQ